MIVMKFQATINFTILRTLDKFNSFIAYGVAIERDQRVIGVIEKAGVGRVGNVACGIVGEGLGRYHRVIAEFLDSSRSDLAETIISITHFGRICKYQEKTAAPESAAEHKFKDK